MQQGEPAAWDAIKRLAATNEAAEQYRIVDQSMDFHQFLTDYTITGLPDPGGCDGLSCRYPLAFGKLYNTIGSNTEQYRRSYDPVSRYNSFPLLPVPPGRFFPIRIQRYAFRTDTIKSLDGAPPSAAATFELGDWTWQRLDNELLLQSGECELVYGTYRGFISHLQPEALTNLTIEIRSDSLPGCRYNY